MKNFIIIILSLVFIGFMSANLQIQTNIENAVQTIKKIFITSDWLTNNGSNTVMTINSGNDGKVYIKNTLETDGTVVLNGIPTNNIPTNYKVLTVDTNNIIQKIDPSTFWSEGAAVENQWTQSATTLSTNKIVWINNIWLNHQFRVGWTSIFQSGWNYIYIYPTNQYTSENGGLASRDNNLKINTKEAGNLYINYDINANTIIKWKTSFNTQTGGVTPTSTIDISGNNGYDQLRLREDYAPSGYEDSNGEIGDITRWSDGIKYYIYIKTPAGRQRAALETFD